MQLTYVAIPYRIFFFLKIYLTSLFKDFSMNITHIEPLGKGYTLRLVRMIILL